jgi:type VI secretion system protein ImpC
MAETVLEQSGAAAQTAESGDFAALLNKEFMPKSDRAREEVESAVRTLAEQVLSRSDIVSDDLTQTIQAYIAELDRKITEQLNLVMHHEDFQKLESAWRGLH